MISTTWKEYVRGNTKILKGSLRLFPSLKEPNKEKMMRDRFRWFLRSTDIPPNELFRIWEDIESEFLEERTSHGEHLGKFYNTSCLLPILLSKSEVDNVEYFRNLYWALKVLQVRVGLSVLVVGPTFGGEVEVADQSGALAGMISGKSIWSVAAEERLIHDEINFQSKMVRPVVAMILSPWVANPARVVRASYNALEEFGFLFFPSDNISMTKEAENLGLLKKFSKLPKLSVYYKDISMKIEVGED